MSIRRRGVAAFLTIACCVLAVPPTWGDAAGDKKRAQLATVKRLVVVPPFFGTETLDKVFGADRMKPERKTEKKQEATPPSAPQKPAAIDPKLRQYADYLQKLEAYAAQQLPKRVATRTPFEVVPAEELAKALEELELTPAKLFLNNGRIAKGKFAAPNLEAVRKLTARLGAEALLLGTMDEPRRTSGGYYFDPLVGLNYDTPHVRSKAGYYLLLADGTEIHHAFIEALQPVTRLGSREFVLEDWKEAEALVIEDLLDELTRYTPASPAAKPR